MTVRTCFVLNPDRPLCLADVRLAVFNWLLARHTGGVMGLCIGAASGAAQEQMDALCWLGLDWDKVSVDMEGATHLVADPDIEPPIQVADLCVSGSDLTLLYLPRIVDSPQDSVSSLSFLSDCRQAGFQPLALVNHLAWLGWTPRGRRELLSLAELGEKFDWHSVSRRPTPFDLARLRWFNHRCLSRLDVAELTDLLVPRWQKTFGRAHAADDTGLTSVEWQRMLAAAVQSELFDPSEVAGQVRFAFADRVEVQEAAAALLARPFAPAVLQAFAAELPTIQPFAYDSLNDWFSGLRYRLKEMYGATWDLRSRDVMLVVRAALTGCLDGPCVVIVCLLLGARRCLERVQTVMEWSV